MSPASASPATRLNWRAARSCERTSIGKTCPLLASVRELAAQGMVTGASGRNWAAQRHPDHTACRSSPTSTSLCSTTPQTSGGLLVSCRADAVDRVLGIFREQGFAQAAVIGEVSDGPVGLTLR